MMFMSIGFIVASVIGLVYLGHVWKKKPMQFGFMDLLLTIVMFNTGLIGFITLMVNFV